MGASSGSWKNISIVASNSPHPFSWTSNGGCVTSANGQSKEQNQAELEHEEAGATKYMCRKWSIRCSVVRPHLGSRSENWGGGGKPPSGSLGSGHARWGDGRKLIVASIDTHTGGGIMRRYHRTGNQCVTMFTYGTIGECTDRRDL